MNAPEIGQGVPPELGELARSVCRGVLGSSDPARLTARAIEQEPIGPDRPTHIIGFGKASIGMALAVSDALGDALVGGIVLAPRGLVAEHPLPSTIEVRGADHPVPTEANVRSAELVRRYARSIPKEHAAVVCVSGGGSAHLCLPRAGVSLDRVIETTEAMNARGAMIGEINTARSGLEVLKHGGLARELAHCSGRRAFVLSDVVGDDACVIASGPMVCNDVECAHTIVGSRADALEGAIGALRSLGFDVVAHEPDMTGSALEAGRWLADRLGGPMSCAVFAGETTVDASGSDGTGGPVTETVASAARALSGSPPGWLVVGIATDGIDGPTGNAGSVVGDAMLTDHTRESLDDALARHDTLHWIRSIGGEITTGPTGSNVNDVCAAIRLHDPMTRAGTPTAGDRPGRHER